MSGYIETLGTGISAGVIATGGINDKELLGAHKRVFWAAADFEFASVLAAKDKDNWDAAVAAGNLVYLGQCKFEDQSAEAQFFEDQPLNIREETRAATKVLRAIQNVNACVHSEIRKLNGRSGKVYIQTGKSFAIGRLAEDGAVLGRAASFSVSNRSVPTTETPVEYTIVDITFTDNDGDENNPCVFKIDWLFSEVDQVYPLTATVGNESSNGTTLTAEITLKKTGTNDPLSDAVLADFKAVDEDGNALTIASVTESGSTGVYTVNITTALTTAYVSFNGIRDIDSAGTLYYMNEVTIKTS